MPKFLSQEILLFRENFNSLLLKLRTELRLKKTFNLCLN